MQGANVVELLVSGTVVDQKNNPGHICCTGSLSGSISDTTGAPLGNVQIAVIDSSANTVTTVSSQADGSYSATNLLAATYSLTFSHTGYQSQTLTGVVVACNAATAAPAIQLVASAPPALATVEVFVLEGDTGLPISGATVHINYGSNSVSETTDGNGLAHFDNQPVNMAASITATADSRTTQAFTSGFVQGLNNLTLAIAPNPPPPAPATVNITVLDPMNNRISGATVQIYYSDGSDGVSGTTDENGVVQFDNQVVGVSANISVQSTPGNAALSLVAGFVSGVNNVSVHIFLFGP